MENRYLFRAKRINNGKWVEGYYRYIPCTDGHYIIPVDPKNKLEGVFVDGETICQCTGAKDKNGKMIWENDLLRYSYDYPGSPWLAAKGKTDEDIRYDVGAVFWQDYRHAWAVCGWGKSRSMNSNIFDYTSEPNRTEVVGNIFDNPELIERE